jgi:hypothetical protein
MVGLMVTEAFLLRLWLAEASVIGLLMTGAVVGLSVVGPMITEAYVVGLLVTGVVVVLAVVAGLLK